MKTSLLCVLSLFACGKTDSVASLAMEKVASASVKVLEVQPASAPAIVQTTDLSGVKPRVGPSVLEQLVLGIERCSLEGYQVVPTCPGMEAFAAGTKGQSATLDAQLGGKLLRHGAPAIRVKTVELMADTVETRTAIAEAAGAERDPGVLHAYIRAVADDGARVPKVGAMLLAAADHADPAIRLAAVDALSRAANRWLTGGPEKLVAVARSDRDPRVRRAACAQGGKLGNDVFLPLYEQATASAADPDMYAACMEGLVAMFHNHPGFDTSSEAAYKLFLRRLEAKPRTEHTPPWSVMSAFCYFSHDADLEQLAAWKKHATYFNPDEVKRAMAGVITDRSASWMARSAAIESMVGLGASKLELAALKQSFDAADRRDKPVVDKLVSVLAE